MSDEVISKGIVWNKQVAEKVIAEAGENFYLVYAWRWSGDEELAKIGKSSVQSLQGTYWTMPKTYHPTDDPVLISYIRCKSEQSALALEKELLGETLDRVRPDREWVVIDENFKHVFFPSDE